MRCLIIVLMHLSACLAPLSEWHSQAKTVPQTFQGWPEQFQGNPLIRMQLTEQERGFSRGFPGKIARFSDGAREIIFRYVERPSRKLHPSADCFRGSGYTVLPQPVRREQNGRLWGCVIAERDGVRYRVCEQIYDRSGNNWYDVSSWFWTVLLENSQGPWWAVTVAERE